MMNFNLVVTERDRQDAAKIERRRIQEEERKKRIFNPRQRLIGVDLTTLKGQIEEKRKRDEEQKRIDKIFQQELHRADQVAVAYETKEKKEKAKLLKEINEYRLHFQRPEDRREFELNDPNRMRKQLPTRLHDDDPRLGPSSAQKFEGEDLISEQRAVIQREQIQSWLQQQMVEKQNAEKERQAAEQAYRDAIVARDQRCIELERLEKLCRKRLDEACSRFNKAQLEERLLVEKRQAQETYHDNMAEIYNTLNSDLMTENPEASQSNMGPGKVLVNRCKGLTAQQRQQIKEDQLAQIAEVKQRKELEARANREYDDYINGIQKSIFFMDKELEQKQRDKNKKIAEENLQMAKEHQSHMQYMDKIVYANRASPEYFEQFNKTTR